MLLFDIETLKTLAAESDSHRQILLKLGYAVSGGNHKQLKLKLKEHNIQLADKKPNSKVKKDISEILTTNSFYDSHRLLLRLIKENLIKNECFECGIKNEWNGKFLRLQLHHKNGEHTDNRIENLEVLCPNCHTQTNNWGGKKALIKEIYKCSLCGNKKLKNSKFCIRCSRNKKDYYDSKLGKMQTKAIYPAIEDLKNMVLELGFKETGKQLGVSGNAIKKYLNRRGF